VLAGAAAVAVLAVLAVAPAPGRPSPAAGPGRPAATVTIARATLTADTIPAATAVSSRRATAAAAGTVSLPGTGSCGLLDVNCYVSNAITSWFASLVTSAVNPLLALIGRTALSTPQPDSIAAVQTLWSTGLGITDACYGLLVLIGGIIVMSHETLQTSYSAKEIAPRIVLGFAAANLSMLLMTRAVDLANGLSAAFTTAGVNPQTAAAALITTLGDAVSSHGIFLILLALAGVVLALVLVAVYVIRLMAVVLLAAAAPVCLALYALPQTAWAARWWWRALTAALAVQAAQGLVLTAAVRVFLSPGWLAWNGSLGKTLITLCLLWILVRIPFWIARPVLSPLGRSPLRRAARFAITAAVLSRIAPALSGRQPQPRASGGTGGTPRRGGPGPATGGPGPARPPRPPAGPAAPAPGGPAPPPAGPPSRPRHAAPLPLPDGGPARPARHEAPPPLPADQRPQRPARPDATPPLPVTRPRHAAPPPLPARRPRHAPPPPLPSASVPPPAPPARPPRRRP
jgi:hypothetical protein